MHDCNKFHEQTHILIRVSTVYSPPSQMLHTFEHANYTVILSLNERAIFIKMTDNVNPVSYEGSFEPKQLGLQLDIANVYKIMHKCLLNEPEYSVAISVHPNETMQLRFVAVVGGFLDIQFVAILREKHISDDGQLTAKLVQMEQKFGALIKRVEELESQTRQQAELIECIGKAEVVITHSSGNIPVSRPINSYELTVYGNGHRSDYNLDAIKLFYRLKTLTISAVRVSCLSGTSNSLEKLVITDNYDMTSLSGLEKFPNLTDLSVLAMTQLQGVVATLSSYPHKIQQITVNNCPKINRIELQTYCNKTGIQLTMS